MSRPAAFDYEAARWGADTVRPGEWSIAGYRLDEALQHLPVRGRVVGYGLRAHKSQPAQNAHVQPPKRLRAQPRADQHQCGDR